MQSLSIAQITDLLKTATINNTTDHGHAIVHVGIADEGHRFVLVNDCNLDSCVSYLP